MSADRAVSRIVRSWLNEDAYEDATRVLDAVLDQINTTPQRRAIWPVRRILTMNSAMRIGGAAVAVIAIALIGINLYRGSGSGSGVGSSPSESPRASATPLPTQTPIPAVLSRPTDMPTDGVCEAERVCLGVVQADSTQHADVFTPHFTFTVPPGQWQNRDQSDGTFTLESIDNPGDFIAFYRSPTATKADGSPVTPAVGTSMDALTAWLTSNPLVTATASTPVTVAGLRGIHTDIAVATGAQSRPAGCPVQACVGIFHALDSARLPSWEWEWGIASGERARLYLVTSPDGVFAIIVDSLDGTTFDALTRAADDLLASVQFK
jgi:hypothetical protein